jgi:2-haloacid dehalogenase
MSSPTSIHDSPPKALLTDVFGTIVNWRLTVTTTLKTHASEVLNSPSASLPSTLRATASTTDWEAFAQEWRESYYHFTHTHDPSKNASEGYKSIDQHHYDSLVLLLAQHGLSGLYTDTQLTTLSLIWHFLTPWPDSPSGLSLLSQKYITATLSNGSVALLSDLAETGKLKYTHILSAEMWTAYKPNPVVYRGAASKLGLKENDCALIAAHLGDLWAARKCGFRTIYVERQNEEGWGEEKKEKAREWVDLWVDGRGMDGLGGIVEVARLLGCEDGEGVGTKMNEKGRM